MMAVPKKKIFKKYKKFRMFNAKKLITTTFNVEKLNKFSKNIKKYDLF